MTNLSDLLPAGAASKQLSFTADGAIASGQTVALQTAGTVKAISSTADATGTEATFQSSATYYTASVYDPDSGKTIIAWKGTSDYGYAVVATPASDNTITYGTPVAFNSAASNYINIDYDTGQDKVLIVYADGSGSNKVRAIVGTVSGTSISFGSVLEVETNASDYCDVAYSPDSSNHLVVYRDGGNSNYGSAKVLTVSGTSVTAGSKVAFNTSTTFPYHVVYDTSNDKFVIAFRDTTNSSYGTAIVSSVSGTTPSFGTKVAFSSELIYENPLVYDSSNEKVVIFYKPSSAQSPTAIVGTVSGTSISFGTAVVAAALSSSDFYAITFDSTANKVVVAYRDEDANPDDGVYQIGTVSGTSISFGSKQIFNDASTKSTAMSFNASVGKVVISYRDLGDSSYGKAIPVQVGFSNASSFLGIADAAISNAASGKITMKGGIASNGLSGLTPNAIYYVQDDGRIASGVEYAAFDIASASFVDSFSVSSQENNPRQIAFNTDGTKMFVAGQTGQDVNEYTLSTGFDVSTASFVDAFDVSPQDTNPQGLAFNANGTKMFVVGATGVDVNEYTLSAGFDVSTASFVDSFSISGQGADPKNIAFNTDGTKMFIVELAGQDVNEYTLSTGFDVSTASFVDSFSVASQETQAHGIAFNTDGTKMFIVGFTGDDVNQYNLSTGFDVSTASFSNITFSLSAQETQPNTIAFSADGKKMFVLGGIGQDVNEYLTSPLSFSTTVEAGKAMSATSINLDYST